VSVYLVFKSFFGVSIMPVVVRRAALPQICRYCRDPIDGEDFVRCGCGLTYHRDCAEWANWLCIRGHPISHKPPTTISKRKTRQPRAPPQQRRPTPLENVVRRYLGHLQESRLLRFLLALYTLAVVVWLLATPFIWAVLYAPSWLKPLLAVPATTVMLLIPLAGRLSRGFFAASALAMLSSVLFIISLGLVDVLLVIDGLLFAVYVLRAIMPE